MDEDPASMERYAGYMAEANSIWQHWTGAKSYTRKASEEVKVDAPVKPVPVKPDPPLPQKMNTVRPIVKPVRPRSHRDTTEPV
jgi:hypothetical protein